MDELMLHTHSNRGSRDRESAASKPRRRRGGFSLIETVVAMGILAVGIVGVTGTLLAAMKTERQSRSLTQAMYLAEQQIEEFRLMSEADILALMADIDYPDHPDGAIDPDPTDHDSTVFYLRRIIQPNAPDPGIFTFTIQVDWTDPHGTVKTTELRSMVAAR